MNCDAFGCGLPAGYDPDRWQFCERHADVLAVGDATMQAWCETCQMSVPANHAHDDACGYCSGGPVVNDECPIHGGSLPGTGSET